VAKALRTYLALQDRDRISYQPGERSANIVRTMITEAGEPDATIHEVGGAYISLGARDCTVGEVAEHVIQRRQPPPGGQARLFGNYEP
jgi:hypothetical protein